jgi:hypothetical protein
MEHFTKNQIIAFDPQIYPRKLWVVLNATRESLEEVFEFDEPFTDDLFDEHYAITSHCRERDSRNLGVVIWTTGSSIAVENMAHETVHFADHVFDTIGENTKTQECYAYLVGWAVKCINSVNEQKSEIRYREILGE